MSSQQTFGDSNDYNHSFQQNTSPTHHSTAQTPPKSDSAMPNSSTPKPSGPFSTTFANSVPLLANIQLPFIILGRKSIQPEIYTQRDPYTRPLRAIHYKLLQSCPNIPIAPWIPETQPHEVCPASLRTSKERQQWRRERRKSFLEGEKARWRGVRQDGQWVLRFGGGLEEDVAEWVGERWDGDGELSDGEREILKDNDDDLHSKDKDREDAQDGNDEKEQGPEEDGDGHSDDDNNSRREHETDDRTKLKRENEENLDAEDMKILEETGEEDDGEEDEDDKYVEENRKYLRKKELEYKKLANRVWSCPMILQRFNISLSRLEELSTQLDAITNALRQFLDNKEHGESPLLLVQNSRCQLKVQFIKGKEKEIWTAEDIEKMLLVLAGYERELLVGESLQVALRYCWISRILEWVSLMKLKRNWKDKRKMVGVERWIQDLGVLDRTEQWKLEMEKGSIGRNVDLWRAIDVMKKNGDLKDFLGVLRRPTTKMAARFDLEHEETEAIVATAPTPGTSSETRDIVSLTLHSHQASLNASEIIAYLDLRGTLINETRSKSYELLRAQAQKFRANACMISEKPSASLVRFCSLLHVQNTTLNYYAKLSEMNEDNALVPDSRKAIDDQYSTDDKLERVVHRIECEVQEYRRYMPVFMRRYEYAAGFQVTPRTKLFAMFNTPGRREGKGRLR